MKEENLQCDAQQTHPSLELEHWFVVELNRAILRDGPTDGQTHGRTERPTCRDREQ